MTLKKIVRLGLVLMVLCPFIGRQPVAWAATAFQQRNPDFRKYEFARSYISALSYFYNIDQRWEKKAPKTLFPGNDLKIIEASINYLSMDNSDLRIAKNYLLTYLRYPNALMRKVADIVVVSCAQDILINEQEKALWVQWAQLKGAGQATPDKEKEFLRIQQEFELKRKENDKQIIQASVYMTKVLLSAQQGDEKGHALAINQQQRDNLLKKLDAFGKGVIDWGLKPGQRTLDASIAVIREVLEDPLWTTVDAK